MKEKQQQVIHRFDLKNHNHNHKLITYHFFFFFAGFLTVHLKTLTFNTKSNVDIDFESEVKLYINGKEVFATVAKQNTPSRNINEIYKSGKISKDSIVGVGVSAIGSPYESIMKHQWNIESFLKHPIYTSESKGPLTLKTLEMEASWQNA